MQWYLHTTPTTQPCKSSATACSGTRSTKSSATACSGTCTTKSSAIACSGTCNPHNHNHHLSQVPLLAVVLAHTKSRAIACSGSCNPHVPRQTERLEAIAECFGKRSTNTHTVRLEVPFARLSPAPGGGLRTPIGRGGRACLGRPLRGVLVELVAVEVPFPSLPPAPRAWGEGAGRALPPE